MGRRGPIKKSAKRAKLAGNPGKRTPKKKPQASHPPDDVAAVAPPIGEATDCPQWLPPAAKAEWARTLPLLKEPLQPRDVAALACYCQSVADLQWASAELESKGRVVANTNGTIGPHPAVKLAAAAMARIKQFAGEFGFTPAARSRVPDPPPTEIDELGEFLAR
jgi:P27 family predicted phage terminase small subunit